MIDKPTIDRIFDTADIVEVISGFVSLKKAGSNYRGFSPFANEKTPSFFVSPSKGIFKCFSSGKGGNVVSFLMEHEKFTYPEALRHLAKKYNIEIEEKELSAEEVQQKNEHESMLIVAAYAQKFFSETLLDSDEGKAIGLSYFKERGFREDIIEKFQLGYCPEGKDHLFKAALENGYKEEYLVKTGLVIDKGDYKFDRFNGRVIFPIHRISGTIVGFGGRTLRSDNKTAKYLNSPESDIYHKSRELYGIYYAKNAIHKADKCFLVEGYTDVISMHQSGIENVVASSGTALTTHQIRLMKRFTKNVTILFDGDEAGIKASLRGIDLILEEGMNVKVLLFPDGEDPDSFVRSNSATDAINYIEENETDFITFKAKLLLEDSKKDPIQKAKLINDIVKSIALIPDNITRSVYIRECSVLLEIEERVLYNEIAKGRGEKFEKGRRDDYRRKQYDEPQQPALTPVPSFVNDIYCEPQEKKIVYFLLSYSDHKLMLRNDDDSEDYITVAEFIINELKNDDLELKNLIYQQVFEECNQKIENNEIINSAYFTHHSNIEISKLAADLLTTSYNLSKIWETNETYVELEEDKLLEVVTKTIIYYKRKILELATREREEKLKLANQEFNEEIKTIMEEIMIIRQALTHLSKQQGWAILK